MQCPKCGREMPDYALFCGHCGLSLAHDNAHDSGKGEADPSLAGFSIEHWEAIPSATADASAQSPASAPSPQDSVPEPAPKPSFWVRHWKVPLAVLLVIAAIVLVAFAVPVVQEQVSMHSDRHHVTFVIRAPGYNDDATPLPVKVEGATAGGRLYSETVFLDGGGNGVVLEPGDYTLSFPGGSILANGTALLPPETVLEINVPQGLPRNEFVQLPPDQAVEYLAVSPLDTTQEMLNDIYLTASSNPLDNGKAEELRDNALLAHEDAISKKDEHTAQVQQNAMGPLTVSVGDSARFVGTLEICSPEDVSARLEDENIQWNYYGRTLAVLWLDEPRDLSLINHAIYGGSGWYDEEGYYHEDAFYTEHYQMRCLLLDDDVEGVYSYGEGDDGTLSGLNCRHVLVSGKVGLPDWSGSLVSPVILANPTFETL